MEKTNEEVLDESQEEQTPKNQKETETQKTPQEEKPDEKSKDLQSALAQKEHQREKREKAEAKVKELEAQIPKKEESVDDWKRKVDFLLTHKKEDYSEDEFNHIAVVAKERGVSLEEASKSEKEYVDFQREKVAKKNNIPEPSSPSSASGEVSEEDIGKMSKEDFEKYEAEQREKIEGSGL